MLKANSGLHITCSLINIRPNNWIKSQLPKGALVVKEWIWAQEIRVREMKWESERDKIETDDQLSTGRQSTARRDGKTENQQ